MPKVVITSDGPSSTTRIEIDGRMVPGVQSYSVGQHVHTGKPVLQLDIIVTELRLETADAEIGATPAKLPVHRRIVEEFTVDPRDAAVLLDATQPSGEVRREPIA